jgi:nucleoside-diphosphate-sugar epimerase
MNILVTGASGFIGRHVVRFLLNKNQRVVGIGRRKFEADRKGFTFIQNDILDISLRELLKDYQIDNIVHLAAVQPKGNHSFEDFARVNIFTTERLMKECKSVKRFIYTSSMNIYGKPTELPVREVSPVSLNGYDYYSLSKYIAERIIDDNYSGNGVFITLRLASVFGVGHDDGIAYTLYSALRKNEDLELYSEGKTIKEMIHVHDVVQIIGRCLALDEEGNHKVNVGYGEKITLMEIAEFMKNKIASQSKIILLQKKSNRNYDFYYSIDVLRKVIGYNPPQFLEGLSDYIGEMASNEIS